MNSLPTEAGIPRVLCPAAAAYMALNCLPDFAGMSTPKSAHILGLMRAFRKSLAAPFAHPSPLPYRILNVIPM